MKALFVHSHRFTQKGNQVYSSDSFPKEVWARYLDHFDEIVVLGRKDLNNHQDISNFSVSSRERVSFKLLDYLESPINSYIYKSRVRADIKKIIIENNINAVIARVPSDLSYRAIDVCKELNIPYAVEVVGCAFNAIYNYKFQPWYNVKNIGVKVLAPFSYYTMKSYVKDSKFSLYVTKEYLQNRYPSGKDSITSNASNVEIPNVPNKVLLEHIGLLESKKEKLRFGMIGNLDVSYKGYDIALKSLARIKDDIPDFKLYLVGGGGGDTIKKLAKKLRIYKNIVFVGKLKSGEEIFNFLDSLDIYLHPSRTEGLPRALIEAMSRGCPCLASNVGGIPELLDNEYLHSPEDYNTLSEQILKLSLSNELLEKAAIKNFNTAKNYTIDVLSKRRSEFWNMFFEYAKNQKSYE